MLGSISFEHCIITPMSSAHLSRASLSSLSPSSLRRPASRSCRLPTSASSSAPRTPPRCTSPSRERWDSSSRAARASARSHASFSCRRSASPWDSAVSLRSSFSWGGREGKRSGGGQMALVSHLQSMSPIVLPVSASLSQCQRFTRTFCASPLSDVFSLCHL